MTTIDQVDHTHYYLGSLCKRGHDWDGTGQSLRKRCDRMCLECARISDRKRTSNGRGKRQFAKRIAMINRIKLERGCIDCGYNVHPSALHFDHLPGAKKCGTIAQMTSTATMERLMEEISKCEVVCANCHAIRTAERRIKTVEHSMPWPTPPGT